MGTIQVLTQFHPEDHSSFPNMYIILYDRTRDVKYTFFGCNRSDPKGEMSQVLHSKRVPTFLCTLNLSNSFVRYTLTAFRVHRISPGSKPHTYFKGIGIFNWPPWIHSNCQYPLHGAVGYDMWICHMMYAIWCSPGTYSHVREAVWMGSTKSI